MSGKDHIHTWRIAFKYSSGMKATLNDRPTAEADPMTQTAFWERDSLPILI